MLILHPDDRDIAYNEYDAHIYYKGNAFTGVLKDAWERTEYKDGLIHGESIAFFKTGNVREIALYNHGKHLKTTCFFENGTLNSELIVEPYSYKVWNMHSVLVRANNLFYYTNGTVSKLYGDKENDRFMIKGYTKNGELMYTVEKDVWVDNKLVRNVIYEDSVLEACYFDALMEENPELADTEEKNDTHQIWLWFWTLFEKDKARFVEIINRLMTHPSEAVIRTVADIIASHNYHHVLNKPSNENAACYKLIEAYTAYHDKNFPDRKIRALVLP